MVQGETPENACFLFMKRHHAPPKFPNWFIPDLLKADWLANCKMVSFAPVAVAMTFSCSLLTVSFRSCCSFNTCSWIKFKHGVDSSEYSYHSYKIPWLNAQIMSYNAALRFL